jgi:ABC-type sulfate/molybdate transport systems ATPase subunit
LDKIDDLFVGDFDVQEIGLMEKQKPAPGFLGDFRARTGLVQFLGMTGDQKEVVGIADRVVKFGRGKVLAVDPAKIVVDMAAHACEQVAGISIEKKSEADDAEYDD